MLFCEFKRISDIFTAATSTSFFLTTPDLHGNLKMCTSFNYSIIKTNKKKRINTGTEWVSNKGKRASVSWQCEYWNTITKILWILKIFRAAQPITFETLLEYGISSSSSNHCHLLFIFHIALSGINMSRTTFFFNVMNFAWNRVYCKSEFYIGNIQKLSLAFSHCLCRCWCKGINLWPHQILAWMIVVHLFEQYRSWSAQPFLIVRKSSVMKSLKNSTGEEECSTLLSLGPVLEELGSLKFREILLQSQLYHLNRGAR